MEDLYFTEEHTMLRNMVRKFAQNEVKPLAQEIDERGAFPHESVKKMAELGLMGIPWEEKYNGIGMDTLALVIAIEELGKVCPSTGATLMAHTSLGTAPIAMFGSEEQKEKYLPGLASGKIIGAFGLTEPNAGSDVQAIETKAVRDGDDYVVNGTKSLITNGRHGNTFALVTKTDTTADPPRRGISIFIAEKGPGFNVVRDIPKLGYKGVDTCELAF